MNGKSIFILVAALLVSGNTFAQNDVKVWSLQECIDYAKANNLEVKMQQINVQRQEVELSTARNSRLPNLSINASQSFSYGRSASGFDNTYQDRNTSSSSWSASTSVPLFTGFQIPNNIAMAKLNLQAVAAELERTKEDMEISVTSAYLQALYNKELLGIANRQADLSREQLERVKRMNENGRASESQIYEAEAQLANDELTAVQNASELQMSILSLTQLLELPTPENFDVEMPSDNEELMLVSKPDAIYETALVSRASIRAEELRLKSSEKSIETAKSAYYPTLSFGAGYSNSYYKMNNYDNPTFAAQLKNNRNEYFGFSLNVPIFNRFSTRNSVRTAKMNARLQALQLESAKKTLYKDIQQAYYNAISAEEKYRAAETAYKSAEKAFGYMKEKFENGRATNYEYNDAKTSVTRALSNRAQSKYEFVMRRKILEFYERQ